MVTNTNSVHFLFVIFHLNIDIILNLTFVNLDMDVTVYSNFFLPKKFKSEISNYPLK